MIEQGSAGVAETVKLQDEGPFNVHHPVQHTIVRVSRVARLTVSRGSSRRQGFLDLMGHQLQAALQ